MHKKIDKLLADEQGNGAVLLIEERWEREAQEEQKKLIRQLNRK